MKTLVIGGGDIGRIVTERLSTLPVSVWFVDPNPAVIARANEGGIVADETDITDSSELRARNVMDASVVVVATDTDSTNLLIAQLLRVRFDGLRIVVRVNEPQNRSVFTDLDVEMLDSADVFATAFRDVLTTPRVERTTSNRERTTPNREQATPNREQTTPNREYEPQ